MKMRFFLLSFIAVCFFSACSKDDDNTPGVNFGSKSEINIKIQKIWESGAGAYNYFEFTPFAMSKTSIMPDGDYKVILADGSMAIGSYIVNDDLKSILLSGLGTLLIKELDDKNFSFTLTLTDNKIVDVSTAPSSTASLAVMYVIKSMRDDLKNNSSLVRIDLATGKETTIIESIKWLEYIKYNASTNEIIGISDDNESAADDTNEYFLSTLNLTTKKVATKSLGTNSNVIYDDFVLVGAKIYAMKSTYVPGTDSKHQIVAIELSTGKETGFMDNAERYEYMEYNPVTKEIIGITESNDLHLINLDTKKITAKPLNIAKQYEAMYDDFILRGSKIYVHKSLYPKPLDPNSGAINIEKHQIIEIELSTGKETLFKDNTEWAEYLGYSSAVNSLTSATGLH